VVDDDRDTLDTLRDVLMVGGVAEVQCATSISEAEQIIQAGFKPSAILLDLLLVDAPGEAFAARMKNDPAYVSVPIIALSGDQRRLRVVARRFDRGFLKPVEPDALLRVLDELCGQA
jgi:CheY-like chemotaxis protein